MKHPQKYGVSHAVKFGDYNVGRDGAMLTLPSYMQFLLELEVGDIVADAPDSDLVNAMAEEILKM